MSTMPIAVKISGKPVRKGGFIPILNLQDADFIIADNYSMSISGDEYYYTVEATEKITVYKLVYNRMTTPGDTYPGTMVIGVGIPRGWRVEAGVDRLLLELIDTFLTNYTCQTDGGLQVYNIKGLDPDVFRRVMDKYPLVEDEDCHMVMNPNGERASIVCDAANIPSVLDIITHREIFSPYSEVLIATRINNAVIRNSVNITELFPPQPVPDPITHETPETVDEANSETQEIVYGTAEIEESTEAVHPVSTSIPAPETPVASDQLEKDDRGFGKWIVLLLLLALLGIGYLLWDKLKHDKDQSADTISATIESVQVRTDTIVLNDTVLIRDTVTIKVAAEPAIVLPRVETISHDVEIPDEPVEPVKAPRFDPHAERALDSGIATTAPTQRDTELLDRCKRAINSPYNGANIVALRNEIAPYIETDSEFDQVDILLSRYKGSVDKFKQIITRINNDPAVKSFREKSRTGRPTGEDRRNFINAISNIVYRPGTKEYTGEIREYIMAIPYLSALMQPYLNSTAQNPTETSSVETQIMAM